MYGVSKPTMGLDSVGDTASFNQVLGHGLSFLHIKDKSGRIFWFVFEKMNETYQYLNMPRFSDEDSMALAKRAMSAEMNDKVTFADLWANRLAYKLVPLEEGLFKYWTWGRVVCIGDSVHKVCSSWQVFESTSKLTRHQWTPNIGQGGNNAIESAALLANKLHRLARQTSHPSSKDVAEALQIFHKRRLPRAESTFQIANLVTRLETLKGPVEEFLALSVIPRVGDWLINQIALGTVGAEKLDFLPDPKRSYSGTMAFNQVGFRPWVHFPASSHGFPCLYGMNANSDAELWPWYEAGSGQTSSACAPIPGSQLFRKHHLLQHTSTISSAEECWAGSHLGSNQVRRTDLGSSDIVASLWPSGDGVFALYSQHRSIAKDPNDLFCYRLGANMVNLDP